MGKEWPRVALGKLLTQVRREEAVDAHREYAILGAHWYAKGLYTKDVKPGAEIRADKVYRVERGDFVYNRLFAWKGSFALASDMNGGCCVSNEFPCFRIDADRLDGGFLWKYLSREPAWVEALGLSHGATPTSRNRLKESRFLAMTIPLPPLAEQRRIVAKIDRLAEKIEEARGLGVRSRTEVERLVRRSASEVFDTLPSREVTLGALLAEDSRNGLGPRPSDTPPGMPILRISAGTSRRDGIVDEGDCKYLEVSPKEREVYPLSSFST